MLCGIIKPIGNLFEKSRVLRKPTIDVTVNTYAALFLENVIVATL